VQGGNLLIIKIQAPGMAKVSHWYGSNSYRDCLVDVEGRGHVPKNQKREQEGHEVGVPEAVGGNGGSDLAFD